MINNLRKLFGTIIIIILLICPETIAFSIPESEIEVPSWKSYNNEEFHISLKYPPDWTKNPNYMERYEGEAGFFAINALAGGDPLTINDVVKFSSEHKLMPYGSNPKISSLKVDGQEARLITASPDQPEAMVNQSELIVRYPEPVTIDGIIYHYFILVADIDHIVDIAKTIKFINF